MTHRRGPSCMLTLLLALTTEYPASAFSSTAKHECRAPYKKVLCQSTLNARRRECFTNATQTVPPRVAFIVAGDLRTFALASVYQSYATHVIDSFASHVESRLFLVLKNAERVDLRPMLHALRPAAVLLENASDARERTLKFRNPSCSLNWVGIGKTPYGERGMSDRLSWEYALVLRP